ncbi:MAG TPA: diguanylate cyclase [Rectinemataceae bacterium]|nr:diguanylate cyclase [Rectinemataceae bacterium]
MADLEVPAVDPAIAIRRRAIFALSLIALLVGASLAAIQLALAQGKDDSRVVNVSGRQRMLSQKIAKLSLEISTAPDVSGRIGPVRDLYEALMIFQGSHDGLIAGSATLGVNGKNSHTVRALYKAIEPSYATILAAASALRLRAVASDASGEELKALSATILAEEGSFLAGMNAIVWRYDEEASLRRSQISALEIGFFGLTLIVLVLEALLIFRPAEIQLSRSFRELHKAIVILREKATYDPLTSLYNRGTGLLLLAHEMEKARRSGQRFSLCFLDLDGLKSINDRFGHEEGDRYIAGFAGIIRGSIRAEDMAFRYGGDEFVLVLASDQTGAESQMERLVDAAATGDPETHRPWAFSHGVASFAPGFDGDMEALIALADQRMYSMKEAHRRDGLSPLRE